MQDNESIYDEQIFPLMAQIIEICKAHQIPMVAAFEYSDSNYCTTIIPQDEQSDGIRQVTDFMWRWQAQWTSPPPIQITVEHTDGSKTIEVILSS